MTVVIDNNEYENLREDSKMLHLDTEYNKDGVCKHYANYVGGSISRQERFTEWGEKTEIKQCPSCHCFHNKHNPPLCYGCAMGLK